MPFSQVAHTCARSWRLAGVIPAPGIAAHSGAGYIPRIPSPTAVGETAQRCALVPWASPSRQITRCCSKQQIRQEITDRFGYDLNRTVEDIRPKYSFDVSCQGTVPEAIIAFLDSISYEDAVRNAISLGGDSDTLACITGGIAEAFYGGIPPDIPN